MKRRIAARAIRPGQMAPISYNPWYCGSLLTSLFMHSFILGPTCTLRSKGNGVEQFGVALWRNGRVFDLRSRGRGFDSRVTTVGKSLTPACLDDDSLRYIWSR